MRVLLLAALAGGLMMTSVAQQPAAQQPTAPHGAAPAQQPAAPPPQGIARPGATAPAPPSRFSTAYPERPPADPAVVERGKALYGVNCTFCHGADARGGSGGPSLIRSQVVLNDKNGELITPLVQKGVSDKMPPLPLTAEQVSDIAAFIHSFKVSGYDSSRQRPPSIVVGDAKAGEVYFNAKCGSCHSVTGDLQGFSTRFRDPRAMQQYWLMPGAGGRGPGGGGGGAAPPSTLKPTTVTVTLPSGQTAEGRLVRIDDFLVILADADGYHRSFRRDGETPKVEVHDPLKPHKDLLAGYRDKDIHDVTAYLVTIK